MHIYMRFFYEEVRHRPALPPAATTATMAVLFKETEMPRLDLF